MSGLRAARRDSDSGAHKQRAKRRVARELDNRWNECIGILSRSSILGPLILLLDLSLEVGMCQPICTETVLLVCKRTSSSGVKSLTMLKSLRISSGDLPLIIFATVLQPTSLWIKVSGSRTSLDISTTNNWLRHKRKYGK